MTGHARQLTLILQQGWENLIITPFPASETKQGWMPANWLECGPSSTISYWVSYTLSAFSPKKAPHPWLVYCQSMPLVSVKQKNAQKSTQINHHSLGELTTWLCSCEWWMCHSGDHVWISRKALSRRLQEGMTCYTQFFGKIDADRTHQVAALFRH